VKFFERMELKWKEAIERAYRKHKNIREAAASLGIPKSTFADRAKELGADLCFYDDDKQRRR
jgi:transcriptional regulator with PAS, ATPase and Fis domain